MQLIISPRAKNDMFALWDYIATDNVQAADDVLWLIQEKLRMILDMPKIGQVRPELNGTIRMVMVKNYLIFYQELTDAIDIIRVLHGAREWTALL